MALGFFTRRKSSEHIHHALEQKKLTHEKKLKAQREKVQKIKNERRKQIAEKKSTELENEFNKINKKIALHKLQFDAQNEEITLLRYQLFPDDKKTPLDLNKEIQFSTNLIANYKNQVLLIEELYPKSSKTTASIQSLLRKIVVLQIRIEDLKTLLSELVAPPSEKSKTLSAKKSKRTFSEKDLKIRPDEFLSSHFETKSKIKLLATQNRHFAKFKRSFSLWFNPERLVVHLWRIVNEAAADIKQNYSDNNIQNPDIFYGICHNAFALIFRQLSTPEIKTLHKAFSSSSFSNFYIDLLKYIERLAIDDDYSAPEPKDKDDPQYSAKMKKFMHGKVIRKNFTVVSQLKEMLLQGPMAALNTIISERALRIGTVGNGKAFELSQKDVSLGRFNLNLKNEKFIEKYLTQYEEISQQKMVAFSDDLMEPQEKSRIPVKTHALTL